MQDSSLAREMADRIEERSKVGRVRIDWNRKHPRLIWHSPTMKSERFFVCSLTPSDHRAHLNSWTQIRRMLLEDGDLLKPTAEELAEAERAKDARRQSAIDRQTEKLKAELNRALARYERVLQFKETATAAESEQIAATGVPESPR